MNAGMSLWGCRKSKFVVSMKDPKFNKVEQISRSADRKAGRWLTLNVNRSSTVTASSLRRQVDANRSSILSSRHGEFSFLCPMTADDHDHDHPRPIFNPSPARRIPRFDTTRAIRSSLPSLPDIRERPPAAFLLPTRVTSVTRSSSIA